MVRDYQADAIAAARESLRDKRSVLIQMPTGAGKTVIVSEITRAAQDKGKRAWFVVPRRELVSQSKAHFARRGIRFAVIDAANKESRAYKAHVVSLQTLVRRLDKIKIFPDLVFIDEAHINYDSQKRIFAALPASAKIIGMTATPERLDGRSLGDLYEEAIYGASIPYLTQCGFLSPLRYYAPPTEGIKSLKFRSGGEVADDELDKLLTERAVYGRAADYYERLARLPDGSMRSGVGFCAGIAAAEKQAAEFRSRGFAAECVHGKMPDKKQRALLDALAAGRVQVLCSADLLLYGWDSPKVSYGFLLRRTKSKALYFQIVGRILRPAEGKADAVFVDHTATVDLHTDAAAPGVPPFYLDHVGWNFHGSGDKRGKQSVPPPEARLCPYDNYMVCTRDIRCAACEKYDPAKTKEEKIIESVPLRERAADMTPHVITPAEKREYQDAVISLAAAAREADSDEAYDKAVRELCGIAKRLGYKNMWVYWQITPNKFTVDARAVHSIERVCGYKRGWSFFAKNEIKRQIEQRAGEGA